MKKIIYLFLLLALSAGCKAQFTTTDSLRRYINKWVRNSPVESFSNLRLNTSLNGVVTFLDSVGAGGSSNNSNVGSAFKLAIPGTRNIKSIANGYGMTFDSATANQVNIKVDSSTIYTNTRDQISTRSHIVKAVGYSDAKGINGLHGESYNITINGSNGFFKTDTADNSTADDTVMTIVTTAGKRLKRIVDNNTLDPRWFGATPNNNADDDYAAIQKCINFAIKNNYKRILFPGGEFTISKGLLIWKDANNDGNPEFINLSIEGHTNAYSGSSQNETVIRSTERKSFVLGIQKGKGCNIKNINFEGTNQINYSLAQAWGEAQTYILDSQRTNQYSPYAGIVLDPFGSSTTGSDRYPGFESYYAGVIGNGGSTDCKFENVVVNGFIVGVILTPNANTQNNESHIFDGLWMTNCREGFVTTNSQERQVLVRNFKAWSNVKTVFQTNGYGAGRGEPPNIDGGNVAGNVYQMFNFSGSGGYFPVVSVRNVYAESFYRIGSITAFNVGFKDCHFSIGLTTENGMKVQDWVYKGSPTTFDNCMLLFYNGGSATPINMVGGPFKFNNCYLGNTIGVPLNQWTINSPEILYSDCRFYTTNNLYTDGYHMSESFGYKFFSSKKVLDVGDENITYAYPERYGDLPIGAMQFRKVKSKSKKWIHLGSVAITVSGDSASATIASLAGKTQYQNKLVFDTYEGNSGGVQIMRIKSIDGSGNVKFDRVVNRLTSTTTRIWIEDMQVLDQPFIFDYNGTTFSNVIKEGDTAAATLSTSGIYYYNSQPTVFSSTSAGNATPVSGLYNSTIKRGILCNYDYDEYGYTYGNPLTNGYFPDGVLFTEGSVYQNIKTISSDSLIYGFRCTKSGVKGSRLAPEFETIYKSKVTGTGYKLVSDATNQVKSLTKGYGILIDSSTTGNINIKLDSSTVVSNIISSATGEGEYTPTAADTSNLDAIPTVAKSFYYKVGNSVTVWGSVTVDVKNVGNTSFTINLPVASSSTATSSLGGTAVARDTKQHSMAIFFNTSNNKAKFTAYATETTSLTYSFHFTYTTQGYSNE